MSPHRTPTEEQEARWLAKSLDDMGLFWTHVPNERVRKIEAIRLSKIGVTPGIPDVLIFNRFGDFAGMALELKRRDGRGRLTDRQKKCLRALHHNGWYVAVAHGCVDALNLVNDYMLAELTFGGVEWRMDFDTWKMRQRKASEREEKL